MDSIKQIFSRAELGNSIAARTIVMNGSYESISLSSTPANPGAVSSLAALSDYAKVCDTFGAVLSVDNGQYLIWNDVAGSQTWNPSAIEETPVAPSGHGTNIAICIGDGVWVMTGWTGLTNSLMFADSDTDLYNAFLSGCVNGSGKDNSDYILTNYGSDPDIATKYPLWDALKTLRQTYAGACIPNSQELRNICFKLATVPSTSGSFEYNTNIAKVFGVGTDGYWSSSQYVYGDNDAYRVDFDNGNLSGNDKCDDYYSFAVLHFA
jgi:hypothetical protein